MGYGSGPVAQSLASLCEAHFSRDYFHNHKSVGDFLPQNNTPTNKQLALESELSSRSSFLLHQLEEVAQPLCASIKV